MTTRNWFRRKESDQLATPFDTWPPIPQVVPVPAGTGAPIPRLRRAPTDSQQPEKFGPALIIGLGHTGELALRDLLGMLALDPAGPQQMLRFLLITDKSTPRLPTDVVDGRQFQLTETSLDVDLDRRPNNERVPVLERFRRPAAFDPIESYIGACLKELGEGGRRETRVFVIAASAEAEISILGNVLELLPVSPNRATGRLANRTVLLALNSPAVQLSDAEQYAVLREVGRLTFSAVHVMPRPSTRREDRINEALLDLLFLVEEHRESNQNYAQNATGWSIGQILSEALYVLLHPVGSTIWEHIQNDLTTTGEARRQTHSAFAGSLGIATLYTPLAEIRTYTAARLARAAIYGEQRNVSEGLLSLDSQKLEAGLTGEQIARDWLQSGPAQHPLFNWLLNANGPGAFTRAPTITHRHEIEVLLSTQLAHGLTRLLNDAQPNHLERAIAATQWLLNRVLSWIGWCNEATGRFGGSVDTLYTWVSILEEWRSHLQSADSQLADWQQVLSPSATTRSVKPPSIQVNSSRQDRSPLSVESPQLTTQSTSDWRREIGNEDGGESSSWRSSPAGRSRNQAEVRRTEKLDVPVFRDLPALLEDRMTKAKQALQTIVFGQVRQPLTANDGDGLHEVIEYYEDFVRPELRRYGVETNPIFDNVRRRLRWWVDLPRNKPPQVTLLCVPAEEALPAGQLTPPKSAILLPGDVNRLGETLLDLAGIQAQNVADHLAGTSVDTSTPSAEPQSDDLLPRRTESWMRERLREKGVLPFLRRAETVYLNFNPQEASAIFVSAGAQRRYLIGRDITWTSRYKADVFPNVSATAVNDVVGGEATRLTALTIRQDIPFAAIDPIKKLATAYNHSDTLHIYTPERLATRYEGKLTTIKRKPYDFPPDLTAVLTDEELVTLFCQAACSGLINVQASSTDLVSTHWTLALPQDDRFPPLALAEYPGPSDGWASLLRAMRRFTTELPYDPRLHEKPADPFHRRNRKDFLAAIREAILSIQSNANAYLERQRQFAEDSLSRWRAEAEEDSLGQAFLDILEIELWRPLPS